MSITEKFSRFMPVGFYYKAFHRPPWLFPHHERQIRKIAGLGCINPQLPGDTQPEGLRVVRRAGRRRRAQRDWPRQRVRRVRIRG